MCALSPPDRITSTLAAAARWLIGARLIASRVSFSTTVHQGVIVTVTPVNTVVVTPDVALIVPWPGDQGARRIGRNLRWPGRCRGRIGTRAAAPHGAKYREPPRVRYRDLRSSQIHATSLPQGRVRDLWHPLYRSSRIGGCVRGRQAEVCAPLTSIERARARSLDLPGRCARARCGGRRRRLFGVPAPPAARRRSPRSPTRRASLRAAYWSSGLA